MDSILVLSVQTEGSEVSSIMYHSILTESILIK